MTELALFPWLEAAVLVPAAGALCVFRVRDPYRAAGRGIGFAVVAFLCAALAALVARVGDVPTGGPWDLQGRAFGYHPFALDAVSAPIVPVVALLHLMTSAVTARRKMRRFSYTWSLASLALAVATLACTDHWVLVALLTAGTVPPLAELYSWRKPFRVYALHMGLFVGLLVAGMQLADAAPSWSAGLLLAAVLVRCGAVPAHCWLTDWFEHASFGNALLFVIPLTGVYAAVRLVLPTAPDWVLEGLGLVSLVTAVYAAGMATVQREARRCFAYLFLSHAALVLVGLELVGVERHPGISLTGSLRLWSSIILSMGGLGLTLRALESRVGRLSLTRFHGLYDQSPALAVCFLLTGLATVGFPGTAGFVAAEMLVDGAVEANPWVGLGVVSAAALNGIAIVRMYFYIFTGTRHPATVPLGITLRERAAVLTLAAILIGAGLVPQPWVAAGYRAAERVLKDREARVPPAQTE